MAAPDHTSPDPGSRAGRPGNAQPDNRSRWRRRTPLIVGGLVALVLVCTDGIGVAFGSSSSTSNAGNNATHATSADTQFARSGPYAAGTTQFTLPNGDPVQVWYPVTPSSVSGKSPLTASLRTWEPAGAAEEPALADLPSAIPTDSYPNTPVATDTTATGGPASGFPVVLLSQGYGSYPMQSTYLTDHLASWGFVVASPENEASDLTAVLTGKATDNAAAYVTDLDDTVELLQEENTGAMFHDLLDLGEIGVVGQSGGGATAITLADNAPIKTYVALAPDGERHRPPPSPGSSSTEPPTRWCRPRASSSSTPSCRRPSSWWSSKAWDTTRSTACATSAREHSG